MLSIFKALFLLIRILKIFKNAFFIYKSNKYLKLTTYLVVKI